MALLTRAGALLLLVASGSLAAAAEDAAGRVVQAFPRVEGMRRNDKWELKPFPDKPYDVFEEMEISTFTGAGARILIDAGDRHGAVLLGPDSRIQLTERTLTQARSLKKLSWLVKLGQFRLVLLPPDPNDLPEEEGECLIHTAAGDLIELTGTDVAVEVARDGTLTVWVIEGEVDVTAAAGGLKRQVPAGYRTRVQPGREPEMPVRFDPNGGPEPRPDFFPGETILPDPPHLDLRAIRLDLPF